MSGLLPRAQPASATIIGCIFFCNDLIGVAEMLHKHLYGFICRMQISQSRESWSESPDVQTPCWPWGGQKLKYWISTYGCQKLFRACWGTLTLFCVWHCRRGHCLRWSSCFPLQCGKMQLWNGAAESTSGKLERSTEHWHCCAKVKLELHFSTLHKK